MNVAALIPAFRPGQSLADLASRLSESALHPIRIVDDGRGTTFAPVFERCRLAPGVRVPWATLLAENAADEEFEHWGP
jgi:hypothetical protein